MYKVAKKKSILRRILKSQIKHSEPQIVNP